MTTSPSEPVENALPDEGRRDQDSTEPDEYEHDQDSEPSANAPADDNPTIPSSGDQD